MKRSIPTLLVLFLFLIHGTVYAALVGQWSFDENIGSTTQDSSGNNNNGVIYGATWVQGIAGSALSFNGANASVVINDSASLNFHDSNSITVSAWVNLSALNQPNYNRIVGHWPATIDEREYFLGVTSGDWTWPANRFTFSLDPNGKSEYHEVQNHVFSDTEFVVGQWYHLVGVYDGSLLKLYVNGVEEDSKAYALGIYNGTQNLYIGSDQYPEAPYPPYTLNGTVDEVSIWNNALSSQEILQFYNSVSNPAPVPEPATMLLLGSGLAGLAAFRRRFRKN